MPSAPSKPTRPACNSRTSSSKRLSTRSTQNNKQSERTCESKAVFSISPESGSHPDAVGVGAAILNPRQNSHRKRIVLFSPNPRVSYSNEPSKDLQVRQLLPAACIV